MNFMKHTYIYYSLPILFSNLFESGRDFAPLTLNIPVIYFLNAHIRISYINTAQLLKPESNMSIRVLQKVCWEKGIKGCPVA